MFPWVISLIDNVKWELNYKLLFLEEKYANRKVARLVKAQLPGRGLKKEQVRIYCTPERPKTFSVVFKLCSILNYKILYGNKRESIDVFCRIQDNTYSDQNLTKFVNTEKCINVSSTDISKKNIEEKFYEVFEYSLSVNPFNYFGKIVKKSNENARHNGEIINAPIQYEQYEERFVYEKLIDNRFDDQLVLDYRIPVYGENIPFVYCKYRRIETRFASPNLHTKLDSPENVFSDYEIKQILKFARSIGMDYGELDILRDKTDGKIYIVDANNTPGGIPNELTKEDRISVLFYLSMAFRELIQQHKISVRGR